MAPENTPTRSHERRRAKSREELYNQRDEDSIHDKAFRTRAAVAEAQLQELRERFTAQQSIMLDLSQVEISEAQLRERPKQLEAQLDEKTTALEAEKSRNRALCQVEISEAQLGERTKQLQAQLKQKTKQLTDTSKLLDETTAQLKDTVTQLETERARAQTLDIALKKENERVKALLLWKCTLGDSISAGRRKVDDERSNVNKERRRVDELNNEIAEERLKYAALDKQLAIERTRVEERTAELIRIHGHINTALCGIGRLKDQTPRVAKMIHPDSTVLAAVTQPHESTLFTVSYQTAATVEEMDSEMNRNNQQFVSGTCAVVVNNPELAKRALSKAANKCANVR